MSKTCGDSFLSIPGSSKMCKMRHLLTKKAAHKAIKSYMSYDGLCVDEPSVKAARKAIDFNMSDGEDLCVDELYWNGLVLKCKEIKLKLLSLMSLEGGEILWLGKRPQTVTFVS
ncbi:uncharacterized protein [Macrobrachium rosenbergii]|uniref:uncharacterized protein n=1 Tax=Macrobrachium rosenbergii TaxID=79674 RepID=UPI0034D41721